MAAAQQQQQLKNEATKMAMRVPLFYGNEKEDTMNIKDFIARFEAACTAMGMVNEEEKCNLFGSYLRGSATKLWINADYHGVTIDNWNSVKTHFLIRYKGKVETNTFCHQIPKLNQEKNESVSDFAERCITDMREFMESISLPAEALFNAGYNAQTAAQKTQAANTHRRVIIDSLAKGCFLMGINQAIKITLMQKEPATLTEAIKDAMKLELINDTNNTAKNKISSLADMDDGELEEMADDLDELTVKQINKYRSQYGRQPFRKGNKFSNGKGNYRANGKGNGGNGQAVIKCRHCDKEGHMQTECRTRIRKNAPLVDRYGKPMSNPGKVANVEDKEAELDDDLVRHLNGFVRSVNTSEESLNFE